MKRATLCLLFLTCGRLPATIVAPFEEFANGELLTDQIPGVLFSNGVVLTAGIGLNDLEYPPYSGVNVLADAGGPMTLLFAEPVLSFGGFFTYRSPLVLIGYDALDQPVAATASIFFSTLALTGDPGSLPNERLDLFAPEGLLRISIEGDPLGGSFTLDNAEWTIVPEPATGFLAGGILLLLGVFSRWSRWRRTFFAIAALALAGNTPGQAQSEFRTVKIVPDLAFTGESSTVTAVVALEPNPDLLINGVTLLETTAEGQVIANLGRMYDDATHGDSLDADFVFALQFTVNETAPRTRYFRATAAFAGRLDRAQSPLAVLQVTFPSYSSEPDPQTLIQAAPGEAFFPVNELLVSLAPGESRQRAEQIAALVGAEIVGYVPLIDLYQFRFVAFSFGDNQQVETTIKGQPGVDSVLRNYLMAPSTEAINDFGQLSPLRTTAYETVKARQAWDFLSSLSSPICDPCQPTCRSRSRVSAAIIDTGVRTSHQEFQGVAMEKVHDNAFSDDDEPQAIKHRLPWGHGTPVAGIIGANNLEPTSNRAGSGTHMNGILSGAHAACRPNGSRIDYSLVIGRTNAFFGNLNQITKAINKKAAIVNMSYGVYRKSSFSNPGFGPPPSGVIGDTQFDTRVAKYRQFFTKHSTVMFVAAAGNHNNDCVNYAPGAVNAPNVITVAATDENGVTRAQWGVGACVVNQPGCRASNFGGSCVDVAAPGEGIYAPARRAAGAVSDGDDVYYDPAFLNGFGGTSGAAPLVSGTVGLVRAILPGATSEEVAAIVKSCRDGHKLQGKVDLYIGDCLLDIEHAVRQAAQKLPPKAAFTMTGYGATSRDGGILSLLLGPGQSFARVSFSAAESRAYGDKYLTSWTWYLGRLQSLAGESVQLDFPVGTYTITLSVRDSANLPSYAVQGTLVVRSSANIPPNAGFLMSGSGKTATHGSTLDLLAAPGGLINLMFDGRPPRSTDPDGAISQWRWTINGAQASTSSMFVKGLGIGTYQIGLTVTDNLGAQGTATGTVRINSTAKTPRTVYLLTRSSADATVAYMRTLLTGASVPFVEIGAAQVASADFRNATIVAAFSAAPAEYSGVPAQTIRAAVNNGAWMIADAFGKFILSYASFGTSSTGGYFPGALDKYGYVKPIDSSPLFSNIPTWDPPALPNRPEQFTNQLLRTSSFSTANYSPPAGSFRTILYWAFANTPGWFGLPTNSTYCMAWGGCTRDRSVTTAGVNIVTLGSGSVLLGITGVGVVPGYHEYGPVNGAFFTNFIRWANE